jgi:excisionase family DNA binding protein
MDEERLTADEVAEMVGVTGATVRTWCRRGILDAWRDGPRKWVIPADALQTLERPPIGRPPKEEEK